MPVTVVVRTGSAVGVGGRVPNVEDLPSITFDGARVVLGRGAGSDVRLPDPSVSARHATIRASGNEYVIVDEGSTNGTWLGGEKLLPRAPAVVKSGDLVRVGRVWLELAIGRRAPTSDLGLATRDIAFALVERAMGAVGDDTIAKVRVAEGPDIGEELLLVEEGRAYVIGRAETCDLPLADVDASREHAVVVRRGAQVLLRDLGSRNGVWLGEDRLAPERDVAWRSPASARIGITVLELEEPVRVALAELEAAADEVMRDEDAPRPPPSLIASAREAHVDAVSGAEEEDARLSARASSARVGPIAELASDVPTEDRPRARRRRVWTMTDLLVVALALAVIGASVASLVWVLR